MFFAGFRGLPFTADPLSVLLAEVRVCLRPKVIEFWPLYPEGFVGVVLVLLFAVAGPVPGVVNVFEDPPLLFCFNAVRSSSFSCCSMPLGLSFDFVWEIVNSSSFKPDRPPFKRDFNLDRWFVLLAASQFGSSACVKPAAGLCQI